MHERAVPQMQLEAVARECSMDRLSRMGKLKFQYDTNALLVPESQGPHENCAWSEYKDIITFYLDYGGCCSKSWIKDVYSYSRTYIAFHGHFFAKHVVLKFRFLSSLKCQAIKPSVYKICTVPEHYFKCDFTVPKLPKFANSAK